MLLRAPLSLAVLVALASGPAAAQAIPGDIECSALHGECSAIASHRTDGCPAYGFVPTHEYTAEAQLSTYGGGGSVTTLVADVGTDIPATNAATVLASCDGNHPGPCVDFDGVANLYQEAAATWGTISQPDLVCVFYHHDVAPAVRDSAFLYDGDGSNISTGRQGFWYRGGSTDEDSLYAGGIADLTGNNDGGKWVLQCGLWDGASTQTYRNGVEETPTASPGTGSITGITVGGNYLGGNPFNGAMAHILFKANATEAEYQAAIARLSCLYASTLTAQATVYPQSSATEYVFDAADIDADGTFNRDRSHNDSVTTWTSSGTLTAAATAPTNSAPEYCSTCCNGRGGLVFDGHHDIMSIASSAANAAFVSTGLDFEINVVYQRRRWIRRNAYDYVIGSTAASAALGPAGWSIWQDGTSSRMVVNDGTGASIVDADPTGAVQTLGAVEFVNWHSSGVGASTLDLSRDLGATVESFTSSGTPHVGSMGADLRIGRYEANLLLDAAVTVCLITIADGEETTAVRDATEAWMAREFGAVGSVQPTRRIAAIGDSLTATNYDRANISWLVRVEQALNASVYTTSAGLQGSGGWQISHCLTEYQDSVDPYAGTDGNIDTLLLWCGTNSVAVGDSAETIFASWEAIVDDAIAEGMTVIVTTLAPRGDDPSWDASKQAELEALNDLIRAKSGPDAIVDAYALLGDPADPTVIDEAVYGVGDFIHINEAGQVLMATQYLSALGGS